MFALNLTFFHSTVFLHFKLSLCSECCIPSFGWFLCAWNFMHRRFGTKCLFHLHRYTTYENVPKRRCIKFRRRWITLNKEYIILFIDNTVGNVWNKAHFEE